MKKMFVFAMTALMFAACGNGTKEKLAEQTEENDSLVKVNAQMEQQIDELLGTLNDIEDGFRQINEAEGRMVLVRDGEGASQSARLMEDMQFIREQMAQNKERIGQLQERLRQSGVKSEQLARTIENLMAQMEEKTAEINKLREELEARNIHIAELDEQVASLNDDVNTLQDANAQLDQTVSQQDQQLNAAWYAIGSKRELKDHHILENGRVLQAGFDASFFTQVDIRNMKDLNLNSKKAEILTSHPQDSYTLERNDNKLYELHITDPARFWSTSKYLVIEVK